MPSKEQDVKTPIVSPVLFMTVDGEPMTFFLRPGPTKRKIQPLITAGGGKLCNVQQPGAILLIDPEELSCIPETTSHWYVSTQYIHDCIKKEEQLNLENYRLNPESPPRRSSRLTSTKEMSGRAAYTSEEDAAILSHVSKHKAEIGGNRLWQEMEKQRVTSHSWQSMKYRYRVRLAKLQKKVVQVATTEKETKEAEEKTKAVEEETEVEENQEASVQKPSSAEDAASPPPTHSVETDSTQIDAQLIPSDSPQPETVDTQTPEEEEEQHVSPQTDEQPAQSPRAETAQAETSEGTSCVDPHTDAPPDPAQIAEQEDEPQTVTSSKDESVPEDSPPAQPESLPESLPDSSSENQPREKQTASPEREQPQHRFTRRQLVLEELLSPEPYAKRLRSSSSSPSSSPQPSQKTKSASKSAAQNDKSAEEPPSKRARGKSEAESRQEESEQAAVPEIPQAESNILPQKAEKKKGKTKLGILELARKEFEDESEISDEEETPDLQNPTETATIQPTSAEPPLPTADTATEAADTRAEPEPEPEPSLQEKAQEAAASSTRSPAKTGDPEPAATEAVTAASRPHLFIFDSETQEEASQSLFSDNATPPSNPQQTVDKDADPSLTQVQLEEDKQRIRELMKQTNQDLVSVTKALLRTSGDFSAALDQLLNPSSWSGPLWTRREDALLLSDDPVVRLQLQEKYSEVDVAKRIMFLEAEG